MIASRQRRRYSPIPDEQKPSDALLRLTTEIHRFRAVTLPPGSPVQMEFRHVVDALREFTEGIDGR